MENRMSKESTSFRLRYLRLFGAICIVATAGLAASVTTASASTDSGASPAVVSSERVAAEMTFSCGSLSASALSYAIKQGYCPASSKLGKLDTVTGSCGSSYVELDNYGQGLGVIVYGFGSTLGTVAYRSLYVSYSGPAASSGFPDTGSMWNANYSASNIAYFGVGKGIATMEGSVTLWWGASCTLLQPIAIGTITGGTY